MGRKRRDIKDRQVSVPWVGVGAGSWQGDGSEEVVRAGKVSIECLGSKEKRRRPGPEDGRYLAMCFSSLLSSPALSSVLHNPEGLVEGGGQHKTGVLSFYLNFLSFLPLQLIPTMWRGVSRNLGVGR